MSKSSMFKLGAAVLLVAAAGLLGHVALNSRQPPPVAATSSAAPHDTVDVSELQARQIKLVRADLHAFQTRVDAVGYIDFNQDRLAQVFSPYPGRVLQVQVQAGEDVKKGQPLFAIASPDLAQAESTLISTAGLLALSQRTLARTRQMLHAQASAQKDLEQATSDQQTAAGNYQAARQALRIFGKSDAEMQRIVASRKVDDRFVVVSPFAGRVTARTIAPGTLVQPGTTPAPLTIADLSNVWAVANVDEGSAPALRAGEPVSVAISALPGRTLKGTLDYVGDAVDPNTHRLAVHAAIEDSTHELRPQMLATLTVQTGEPMRAVAVPTNAVVREGDGSMTVFATQDGRRFVRREVRLGLQQDGLDQVLHGLAANEQVAGDGALFLSAALALQSQ